MNSTKSESITRRSMFAGATAAIVRANLPGTALMAFGATAALSVLDAKREELWAALDKPGLEDDERGRLCDEWAGVIEEISLAEARDLQSIQIKARALEQYAGGFAIETDEDAMDGRLLHQILSFLRAN